MLVKKFIAITILALGAQSAFSFEHSPLTRKYEKELASCVSRTECQYNLSQVIYTEGILFSKINAYLKDDTKQLAKIDELELWFSVLKSEVRNRFSEEDAKLIISLNYLRDIEEKASSLLNAAQ